MTASDAPLDLYIAYYGDEDDAQADYDDLKALADEDSIKIEAMVVASRDTDGKIHVKDSAHTGAKGAGIGAVVGLVVGAIFPPSLLAGAIVGGLIGGGAGSLVSRHDKKEIKADLEDGMPPDSSAIVAVFDEVWVDQVEAALTRAVRKETKELDEQSKKAVKEARKEAG